MTSPALRLPILLFFLQVVSWCYGSDNFADCPRSYRGRRGTFHSLTYPRNYSNNEYCDLTFSGYERYDDMVELYFDTFQTEFSYACDKDYLTIGDQRYCGKQLRGKTVRRRLPLVLSFTSDAHFTFKGFHGSFVYINGDCPLHTINDTYGYITSPNYPMNYPQSYKCEYTFPETPIDEKLTRVVLKFSLFDVEYYSDCSRDSLNIDNVKYCGRKLDQQTVTMDYPPKLISFVSDLLVEKKGFTATYDYQVKVCNVSLTTNTTGYLQSPYYPSSFPYGTYCYYHIPLPTDTAFKKLILTFTKFDIYESYYPRCKGNSLRIDDHDYCGYDLLQESVIVSFPARLLLQAERSARGFYAHYKYVKNVCELVETDETSGLLQSIGYPEHFPINLDCTYTIPKKPGFAQFVTLSFLEFHLLPRKDLICKYEYLEINRHQYCGEDLKGKSFVVSLPAVIGFKAGGTVYNRKGFNATYVYHKDSCDIQPLTETNGTFQSPGYPQRYPNNLDCTYTIPETDASNSVTVTFSTFQLEVTKDCKSDSLEISGSKYCGKDLFGKSVKLSLPADLHFHTDSSLNFPGFSATYEYETDEMQ